MLSVADNSAEINERFYSELSFGTGGLRGELGAGTSRMNIYTVKFSLGVDGLPKINVLRFKNDEVRLIIRPSGTEPKLKIYYQAKGENKKDAIAN